MCRLGIRRLAGWGRICLRRLDDEVIEEFLGKWGLNGVKNLSVMKMVKNTRLEVIEAEFVMIGLILRIGLVIFLGAHANLNIIKFNKF